MPQDQPKPAAPYLPWKTFLGSLEPFTQGIPPRIDRELWRQSGLMQGLIMGSYRFFGLIDDSDRPTAILTNIVTKPEQRAAIVRDLLKAGYPEIMAHDLTTMTLPILQDLIEKHNVSGETRKKAITFFLQAAKYAGLPLSTFIKVRSTSGTRRRRQRNNGDATEILMVQPPPAKQEGTEKVIELTSGGTVSLKVSVDILSISESDRKFVFDLIDKVNNYLQTRRVTRLESVGTGK